MQILNVQPHIKGIKTELSSSFYTRLPVECELELNGLSFFELTNCFAKMMGRLVQCFGLSAHVFFE